MLPGLFARRFVVKLLTVFLFILAHLEHENAQGSFSKCAIHHAGLAKFFFQQPARVRRKERARYVHSTQTIKRAVE